MDDREYYVIQADYANKARRYEDMWELMKKVTALSEFTDFTDDEKHIFQKSFKQTVAAKRVAWKVIRGVEKYEKCLIVDGYKLHVVRQYRLEIEKEARDLCHEMLDLINDTLWPKAKEMESKILYQLLIGDCYRYLAEITIDKVVRKEVALKGSNAYLRGRNAAKRLLLSIHPLTLSLECNYALLLRESLEDNDEACAVLQEAVDSCGDIKEYNSLPRRDTDLSLIIYECMKEYIEEWKAPSPQSTISSPQTEEESSDASTSKQLFVRKALRKSCNK